MNDDHNLHLIKTFREWLPYLENKNQIFLLKQVTILFNEAILQHNKEIKGKINSRELAIAFDKSCLIHNK